MTMDDNTQHPLDADSGRQHTLAVLSSEDEDDNAFLQANEARIESFDHLTDVESPINRSITIACSSNR